MENNYTLNKDNPKFVIFTYTLEDDFKNNSILEVNCKVLYDYTAYKNIYIFFQNFLFFSKFVC